MRGLPRHLAWTLGVSSGLAALVAALYGDALGYAFMYDDSLDLARGEQRSVWSLLTSGEGAYYYRPLPFLFWKALHALLGRYDLVWFHLPPLALHALNAWLVYALGRVVRLPRAAALVAAVLFALTPFHYQTVPWAGALFHPLVTALMLGALLAYWRARVRGGLAWHGLSLLCAGLALFTQEYAVTLPALVAGLELVLWRQGQVRAPRPYAVSYAILALGFCAWWLAVPKWPRATPLDPLAQPRNLLLYLQAALWPLALGWRWAPPELWPHAQTVVALGGGAALALATWFFLRARAGLWLALALGWLVVTALPAAATLPWEYLVDGPRLYYLPSVGIALGWAALLAIVPRAGLGRAVGVGAAVLVLGTASVVSLQFLAERRGMYAEGSALLHAAAALAAAAPEGSTTLFVNSPAWRAPAWPAFPLGTTGVTYVPEYVALGQALHVNGGTRGPVESVSSPDLLPGGWPTHYGPHGPPVDRAGLAALSTGASAAYAARYHPLRWEVLVIHNAVRVDTRREAW